MPRKTNLDGNLQKVNSIDNDSSETIKSIKEKLDKSPALNGEFDTLLHKVDKIEECNGNLNKKVDKIYDAIYHHDDGIIAKMKENAQESRYERDKNSGDLTHMKEWKIAKDKSDEKIATKLDNIESLNETVKDLVEAKNTTWSITKWFIAALGGGIITILSRYVAAILIK